MFTSTTVIGLFALFKDFKHTVSYIKFGRKLEQEGAYLDLCGSFKDPFGKLCLDYPPAALIVSVVKTLKSKALIWAKTSLRYVSV